MNCIIIEDEPAAQSILERYISLTPGLECSGVFGDALSAQTFLDKNKTDLIFLDINLPEISGVSFLRSLLHPPLVIFTTAYPEYAMDGFDLEITDFLLKPISFERFCKAVNKAKEKLSEGKSLAGNMVTVKSDRSIYQMEIGDILFIEAMGDYLTIQTNSKKLVVHGTLKSWQDKLKGHYFMKIHRSTLINLHKISHIEGNLLFIGKHELRISEPYKAQLMERLLNNI